MGHRHLAVTAAAAAAPALAALSDIVLQVMKVIEPDQTGQVVFLDGTAGDFKILDTLQDAWEVWDGLVSMVDRIKR